MANRANDWLSQAKRDLQHSENDLKSEFYEWASFSAQQAAEKAVKALYQSLNMSVRGHSVLKMLEALRERIDISEGILHAARILDRYYLESRYPNGFPSGSPMDYFDKTIAEEAYNASDTIIRFCDDTISRS